MTLGALGTMVWDRIEHPEGETVERWGGISYSLAAMAAAMPRGWTVRPIIRLGADLAREGRAFLGSVPGLAVDDGVMDVDEPNNRVRLQYRDRHHRDEHLMGGVGSWQWAELEPRLEGLDGLYVNLVSGSELDTDTAAMLRERFHGPRYVDIHSLVLGIAEDGTRVPEQPGRPAAWFGAFHVVQLNHRELEVMAGGAPGESAARAAVERGTAAVLVTRGPRGASWFARDDGPVWPRAGREPDEAAPGVRAGDVTLGEPAAGDPTGCGDVWGATCFVRLAQGHRLTDAMAAANRAAARNVDHRGADGLYRHLRGDA